MAVIGASRDPGKLSYGIAAQPGRSPGWLPWPGLSGQPQGDEILGLRCYPDIGAVPDPARPGHHRRSGRPGAAAWWKPAASAGVKAGGGHFGGFREVGPEGAARERQVAEIARAYGMRLMGPNGIGVIDTHTPLNTTFVRSMPPRGDIAFLSQSGALCGGIIDWAISRRIGFSRLLSVGNEADVNETDADSLPGCR